MLEDLIRSWCEEFEPAKRPMLLSGMEESFVGLCDGLCGRSQAVYMCCPKTAMRLEELSEHPAPPLMLTPCSLEDPDNHAILQWLAGAFGPGNFKLLKDFPEAFAGVAEGNGPPLLVYDRDICAELMLLDGACDTIEEAYTRLEQVTVTRDPLLGPLLLDCVDDMLEWRWETAMPAPGSPAVVGAVHAPGMPCVRVWPPHPVDTGASLQDGPATAWTCARDLCQALNGHDPLAVPPTVESGEDLWLVTTPEHAGLVFQIAGPFEDADPQHAFGGLCSGSWKQRNDRRAKRNRANLRNLLVRYFSPIEEFPDPKIQDWAVSQ